MKQRGRGYEDVHSPTGLFFFLFGGKTKGKGRIGNRELGTARIGNTRQYDMIYDHMIAAVRLRNRIRGV